MPNPTRRFLGLIVILLISSLATLSGFVLLVLAQEPSPLRIRVMPQTENAVAGLPFTYTVVVTNVGQMPVTGIILFTETPTGTTLIETHQQTNWLVGGVQPGEAGPVVWNRQEAVAPAEVVTFNLVVNVLPEMADQPLVSREYTVLSEANVELFAIAPPITTQVLAIIPTPTSLPSPTTIVISTATPSPIPSRTPQPEPSPVDTATLPPATPTSTIPASTVVVSVIMLVVLGGVMIGLARLLRRR